MEKVIDFVWKRSETKDSVRLYLFFENGTFMKFEFSNIKNTKDLFRELRLQMLTNLSNRWGMCPNREFCRMWIRKL